MTKEKQKTNIVMCRVNYIVFNTKACCVCLYAYRHKNITRCPRLKCHLLKSDSDGKTLKKG